MVTVADSATHLAQPSHKLYQPQPDATPSSSDPKSTLSQLTSAFRIPQNGDGSAEQPIRPLRRDLTGDERQGLYVLLGLFGTVWVATGLFERAERTKDHSH